MAKDMKIKIPSHLVEKINRRMEGSDFDSVEEYVKYVLEEVVSEDEEEYEEEEEWSEEDEEKVKSRLRSLGYLE